MTSGPSPSSRTVTFTSPVVGSDGASIVVGLPSAAGMSPTGAHSVGPSPVAAAVVDTASSDESSSEPLLPHAETVSTSTAARATAADRAPTRRALTGPQPSWWSRVVGDGRRGRGGGRRLIGDLDDLHDERERVVRADGRGLTSRAVRVVRRDVDLDGGPLLLVDEALGPARDHGERFLGRGGIAHGDGDRARPHPTRSRTAGRWRTRSPRTPPSGSSSWWPSGRRRGRAPWW